MDSKQVGIIGYGRFGQFFEQLLSIYHIVWVTDREPKNTSNFLPLAELCSRVDAIFLCVPINQLEAALQELRPHLQPGTVLFDTCSVKLYPAKLLKDGIDWGPGVTRIAAHPMFGPDSAASGYAGLPMVCWLVDGDPVIFQVWVGFFKSLGIKTVEISPDEHDQLAAYSQGVTHYVGRVLGELQLKPTEIDTHGFRILRSLIEQTCNDSLELFQDLQRYNPYTRQMRLELEDALARVYESLLPERVEPDRFVVAIQGGKGSFNEEACRHYTARHEEQLAVPAIAYRYTTENVLRALHEGEADFGVFAIQNARGGVVMETIHALSTYTCELVEVFEIVISHCILLHPDAKIEQIDTLISHPQALAQCAGQLAVRYPELNLISGEGDLIDQALCAEHLAAGKLPRTTAVLAPEVCAELFGLVVADTNLQDLGDENLTAFGWARRRQTVR